MVPGEVDATPSVSDQPERSMSAAIWLWAHPHSQLRLFPSGWYWISLGRQCYRPDQWPVPVADKGRDAQTVTFASANPNRGLLRGRNQERGKARSFPEWGRLIWPGAYIEIRDGARSRSQGQADPNRIRPQSTRNVLVLGTAGPEATGRR
jgi:hypothetical protein